jgi:hypothetical protein
MIAFSILRQLAIGVALVISVAACGSAASPTIAPSTAAATAATTASTAPTAATTPTLAPTAAPSLAPTTAAALPAVDLIFTGTYSFIAKGSAGQCLNGPFNFQATEADYPGFGQAFEVWNDATTGSDLKWVGDTYAYGRAFTTVMSLSADGRTMQISGPLQPFGPAGGPLSGPESVSGSITCP